MASVYDLKPKFQNLLRPIARLFANKGITANQVTIAALVLSFLIGGLLFIFPNSRLALFLVPAVLFIRMALNALDGMLAREFNMKSDFGAVLNELGDVLSDTLLYLPFAYVSGFIPELVVLIVILSIISEMTGIIAVQIGRSRRYEGPMGKSDRAFIFGLIAILLGCGVSIGTWLVILQYLIAFLLVLTIINRARKALIK